MEEIGSSLAITHGVEWTRSMARPLRIEYPGALYHITCRGNARDRIYPIHADRELLLQVLAQGPCLYRSGAKDVDGVVRAYVEYGYTQKEIAANLGVHYSTISRQLR